MSVAPGIPQSHTSKRPSREERRSEGNFIRNGRAGSRGGVRGIIEYGIERKGGVREILFEAAEQGRKEE
jgi:hypothetical protein